MNRRVFCNASLAFAVVVIIVAAWCFARKLEASRQRKVVLQRLHDELEAACRAADVRCTSFKSTVGDTKAVTSVEIEEKARPDPFRFRVQLRAVNQAVRAANTVHVYSVHESCVRDEDLLDLRGASISSLFLAYSSIAGTCLVYDSHSAFPDLKYISFGPVDDRFFEAMSYYHSLDSISIHATTVTPERLQCLAGNYHLRMFGFHWSKLEEGWLEVLKQFPVYKLELSLLALKDSDFAELSKLKTIVALDFDEVPVNDVHLQAIAKVSSLKKIRIRRAEVTSAGRDAFIQLRPDVSLDIILKSEKSRLP